MKHSFCWKDLSLVITMGIVSFCPISTKCVCQVTKEVTNRWRYVSSHEVRQIHSQLITMTTKEETNRHSVGVFLSHHKSQPVGQFIGESSDFRLILFPLHFAQFFSVELRIGTSVEAQTRRDNQSQWKGNGQTQRRSDFECKEKIDQGTDGEQADLQHRIEGSQGCEGHFHCRILSITGDQTCDAIKQTGEVRLGSIVVIDDVDRIVEQATFLRSDLQMKRIDSRIVELRIDLNHSMINPASEWVIDSLSSLLRDTCSPEEVGWSISKHDETPSFHPEWPFPSNVRHQAARSEEDRRRKHPIFERDSDPNSRQRKHSHCSRRSSPRAEETNAIGAENNNSRRARREDDQSFSSSSSSYSKGTVRFRAQGRLNGTFEREIPEGKPTSSDSYRTISRVIHPRIRSQPLRRDIDPREMFLFDSIHSPQRIQPTIEMPTNFVFIELFSKASSDVRRTPSTAVQDTLNERSLHLRWWNV